MLEKMNNGFKLYPWKVRYIQHEEEIEQWALPNKEWWTDFADKWEHTEIIEFVEVELTAEQLARAREIEQLQISEGHRDICIDYILEGVFPEGITHPLRDLQVQRESLVRDEYLIDLDFRLSLKELEVEL